VAVLSFVLIQKLARLWCFKQYK